MLFDEYWIFFLRFIMITINYIIDLLKPGTVTSPFPVPNRPGLPGLPGPAFRFRRTAEAPKICKAMGLVAQVLVDSLDLQGT